MSGQQYQTYEHKKTHQTMHNYADPDGIYSLLFFDKNREVTGTSTYT
jgi:hypothetical protein